MWYMAPMNDAPIRAAGVLVYGPDGRILAFRRADTGGLGLPFGAVDPGETPQQAAQRECLEEAGHAVALLPQPPFIGPTPAGNPAAAFRAELTGEHRAPTHPEEGQAEWVSHAQLMAETDFAPYLAAMFAFFAAH